MKKRSGTASKTETPVAARCRHLFTASELNMASCNELQTRLDLELAALWQEPIHVHVGPVAGDAGTLIPGPCISIVEDTKVLFGVRLGVSG